MLHMLSVRVATAGLTSQHVVCCCLDQQMWDPGISICQPWPSGTISLAPSKGSKSDLNRVPRSIKKKRDAQLAHEFKAMLLSITYIQQLHTTETRHLNSLSNEVSETMVTALIWIDLRIESRLEGGLFLINIHIKEKRSWDLTSEIPLVHLSRKGFLREQTKHGSQSMRSSRSTLSEHCPTIFLLLALITD